MYYVKMKCDIVDGTCPITSPSRSDIYAYYTNKPVIPDELFSKKVTKGGKPYTQDFNCKWLEDHVYSKKLEGGMCKVCVLFEDHQNKGIFVKTAFQHVTKPERTRTTIIVPKTSLIVRKTL